MVCKTCENSLRSDFSYCPSCGGKIIRNRLTIKNIWQDIVDRYFNIDNTFLRTIVHLTTKPETVIEGYINGIRRKYLNPISYLGIAITLSGFLVFLMKYVELEIDFDFMKTGQDMTGQKKVQQFTLDYQAILFILYIPLMAIAGWLSFENKSYNFSERIVIFMYSLSQYSILTLIPSILILFLAKEFYMVYSLLALGFMYLYNGFVIKRISQEKGIALFAKIILFWGIFTMLYITLSLFIPLILILIGEASIQDFLPKKA
jgi:hypothetical protein